MLMASAPERLMQEDGSNTLSMGESTGVETTKPLSNRNQENSDSAGPEKHTKQERTTLERQLGS